MLCLLPMLFVCPASTTLPTLEPRALVRQDDFESLKKQFRDTDGRERRKAVKGLAVLGSEEAWDLVFDALEDSDAQVADEAQLLLGSTNSLEIAKELLSGKRGLRAKNDLARARCVEAVGRLTLPVEGHLLLKNLKSKIALERRAVCWSVERLCLAGNSPSDVKGHLEKELTRVSDKDKDEEVRAAAIIALAAFDPERSDVLFASARNGESTPLRIAALELCPVEKRTETAAAFAGSEARALRTAAIRVLAEEAGGGNRDAVSNLIDRLEHEQNERLSWRIVSELQRITGRKSRRDASVWRSWWEAARDEWTPEKTEKRSILEADERSASFVGLPLLSDHLAFLVDFSGSTWKKRGGTTRKEKIDVELRRALEGLPESAFFELVPYTSEPHPWQGKLAPATKKNVKKAGDWFESQKMSGTGDFLEAAEIALEIHEADTQVVLTDGAPSGGERWNLELLVPWLLERNRFRQITFDVVLVDAPKGLIRYWERLADGSGGRVLSVDLDK